MKITFDADPRDMASMAMLHNVFSSLAASTPTVTPTVEKPKEDKPADAKPADTKRTISERELLSLRKLPSTPAERSHLGVVYSNRSYASRSHAGSS